MITLEREPVSRITDIVEQSTSHTDERAHCESIIPLGNVSTDSVFTFVVAPIIV